MKLFFCVSRLWLQVCVLRGSSLDWFLPRPDTRFTSFSRVQVCRNNTSTELPWLQRMTSLSNCNPPNALIKRWGKSAVFPLVRASSLGPAYFRQDLGVFFQLPEVEWHVTQVYKMMMFLFLYLAVNFILLINKPTSSSHVHQGRVISILLGWIWIHLAWDSTVFPQ